MSQLDLFTDLPRGEQLQLLRRLKLNSYKHRGRSVSGAICKSVIRAIDDRAGAKGCFASQSTIADEVGCGVATVSRAIAALVAQDLITVEKVNPWSPNTHRINWTAVANMPASLPRDGKRQEQTLPKAKPAIADGQDRDCPGPRPSLPEARQIAPLIDPITDHLTEAWAALADEMRRWGLQSAKMACTAAQGRGVSIELATELFVDAGRNRSPEPWEPGQLANWLTGKTPPPIDESAALARIQTREQAQSEAAAAIRESVRNQGVEGGHAEWIINGITHRKLVANGLGSLATDAEKAGAKQMEAIDRARNEKRAHRIDGDSVSGSDANELSRKQVDALRGVCRVRRVPRERFGARDCELRRQEINRTLAALN
tara:strand:- start:5755 stop:6870 length:1116 start_codon:yes stop_codon:yes gene_type:complete